MPVRCVAGFGKKFGSSGRAIPAHPEPCALLEASRHAISKPIRQEKVRVPFFRSVAKLKDDAPAVKPLAAPDADVTCA
jgi:hypothetical protein